MLRFADAGQVAGTLLVASVMPAAIGIFLFASRNGMEGGSPPSSSAFIWERGLFVGAVLLTAVGLAVLEGMLSATDGRVLARLGATAFGIGAVLLATAELTQLPHGQISYPMVVAYVLLAFIGQAAIGGALLQAAVLPAWAGWLTVGWNLGAPIILLVVTPGDIYFPFQHHVMPLLIGIVLVRRH